MFGPVEEASWGPFLVAPVGLWHVVCLGGEAPGALALMDGNLFALVQCADHGSLMRSSTA
uniref:Uncharacterized protein n=1 Tax=Candidatus Kentrum sp. LPFa TaxID=2126335 RepID=A0A450Y8G9_9GAMM|nr:MAG: hypothetical protein BECKLPF1236C_GA0070990_108721 [Candidatus Kentron sp. LPFa]